MITSDPNSPTLALITAMQANNYGSVVSSVHALAADGMSRERLVLNMREAMVETLSAQIIASKPGVWCSFIDNVVTDALARVDFGAVIDHVLAHAAGKQEKA